MAEYIEREAVRKALYEADAITMKGVAILNQFPAADVVERPKVVRCRDCVAWGGLNSAHECTMISSIIALVPTTEDPKIWLDTEPDDFCSSGIEKEKAT